MTVPAAARTLDIFEVFARERRPLSVSGLAKATNMPLSSCHGLIKTLEARGYLVESKSQGAITSVGCSATWRARSRSSIRFPNG